jgi:drug/metabolite transporter (DMT)-like permease
MVATYLKLLLMALFWGGTFIAGRVLAQSVGPYSGAFLRFAVASACLAAVMLKMERHPARPGGGHLVLLLLMGMTGIFAYNVLFLKGLKLIEAGRAAIIIANNPIGIALMAAIFFGERLNILKAAGILVSVAGAIIVITRGDASALFTGGFGRGELYILGCVASWVAYSLLGKLVMARLSPLAAVTFSSVVGTLCLFPAALLDGLPAAGGYPLAAWVSIVYLGFFGTVLGFVWYYEGIQRIGPVRAGLFINFVPVFAVLLSVLLLGEPLTLSLIAGAALVCTGVCLTTLGAHRS